VADNYVPGPLVRACELESEALLLLTKSAISVSTAACGPAGMARSVAVHPGFGVRLHNAPWTTFTLSCGYNIVGLMSLSGAYQARLGVGVKCNAISIQNYKHRGLAVC